MYLAGYDIKQDLSIALITFAPLKMTVGGTAFTQISPLRTLRVLRSK